jgi:hypothetical protein
VVGKEEGRTDRRGEGRREVGETGGGVDAGVALTAVTE